MHAKAGSTSDSKDWSLVPSKSDSNTKHDAKSDSNPTRSGYTPQEAHLVSNPSQDGHSDLKSTNDTSSSQLPPIELKPLLSHLKFAYLDAEQHLLVIIANDLHRE
ncbi:hypothetical protein CR513_10631, partial [Mucuna pruriens]